MRYGICPRCKKTKYLTKHSKSGGHKPPFERICRKCHDEEHGITPHRVKEKAKYKKFKPKKWNKKTKRKKRK